MRILHYLTYSITIFLIAVTILIGIHWAEVSELLITTGSQILALGLKGVIMIGAVILMLKALQ